ncbi:hypothetical protein ACFOU2_17035 [Bacillus songklensis]|uniref:Uncharacterized protein n=1 Tax=Bacillus songklensis TaxID=1069116 RepID=A0ABV8B5B1_9BACI
MGKIHFLVSEFFFTLALGITGLLYVQNAETFSLSTVFLGLIAGALIDMNLRFIYNQKNSVNKVSRFIEHKQDAGKIS